MNKLQDIIESIQEDDLRAVKATQEDNIAIGKEKLCKKCHQPGHFANKCPAMSEKKKSKMKCHLCGESGHNRSSCPGVDDDGAGQSVHKGNSTAKNNTGEKKKKGKDKVRAQKMMRGKKKERGQSIDEKDSKSITYPVTSIQFHDMLSGEQANESCDDPTSLLAGFISPCVPYPDKYAFTFSPPVPEDSLGLLGYAIGVPPEYSALWLRHISTQENGEDIALAEAFSRVGVLLKIVGPIGLDYREQVVAHNSMVDQLDALQRQIAVTNGDISPNCIMIKATAPSVAVTTETVFNLPSKCDDEGSSGGENAGASIDKDLFKALYSAEHLRESESSVAVVIILADCGLKYSTISALMDTFPNLYFSLDGRLTHSKQKLVKEYAFDIPLSRLLFATMAPQYPVAASCTGGVSFDASSSTQVLFIAEALAAVKNVTIDEVLETCLENSNRILHGPR